MNVLSIPLLRTVCVGAVLSAMAASLLLAQEPFDLTLRQRKDGLEQIQASWNPAETAVIVCDMWDAHHCLNATKRGAELAAPMNSLLAEARGRGATIIHAPSSCMTFYQDHPARKRAQEVPHANNLPPGISEWLNWIDEKEQAAGYPIDHTDGGEDDEAEAHQKWHEELAARGRNPKAPWIRQTELLTIDPDRDFITDDGIENWSILEQRGIKNVLLLGVHTNMCVLGRPFGLRQLSRAGKNVALVRDLTDTMYNPAMPPFVSHFRGTDLIIDHVETYVCPTVTSDQILGGAPFRFEKDSRPQVVCLIAEYEYETWETVPKFMESQLGADFRFTYIHADDGVNALPGIEALSGADLLFVSVRRRALPEAQMAILKHYVASGRPVIGIRTASHAFSLRGEEPPEGLATWESFDPEIFGGHYTNHTGNEVPTFASLVDSESKHPILSGVPSTEFATGGSLYRVSPLEKGTEVLLVGRAGEDKTPEPVAWTHRSPSGGRVFYTSLGHKKDFEDPAFTRMLRNAVYWATGKEAPEPAKPRS